MRCTWIPLLSLLFIHSGFSLIKIPFFGELVAPDPICLVKLVNPWPASTINPVFEIHTKSNIASFRLNNLNETQTKIAALDAQGYFAIGRQVVFIVHGFMNSQWFPWIGRLKDAIIKEEDSTVITVSWGFGAATLSYNQAGSNTQTMAAAIASVAEAILNSATFNGKPDQIYLYCIGHSLGAQVCGQAGRKSGHFNRVTGLDPAGPGFENCWTDLHIDTDSAKCVDNIHTDGTGDGHLDPFIPHYGSLFPWGHVDFYPNAGKAQKACSILTNDMACSHLKAIDYFTYSIGNKTYCTATGSCTSASKLPDSCANTEKQQMGYFSSCHKSSGRVKEGMFYLTTGSSAPWC